MCIHIYRILILNTPILGRTTNLLGKSVVPQETYAQEFNSLYKQPSPGHDSPCWDVRVGEDSVVLYIFWEHCNGTVRFYCTSRLLLMSVGRLVTSWFSWVPIGRAQERQRAMLRTESNWSRCDFYVGGANVCTLPGEGFWPQNRTSAAYSWHVTDERLGLQPQPPRLRADAQWSQKHRGVLARTCTLNSAN